MSADSIILSIPREQPYIGVARLVVGGLAARLDLSYENLEDLQLALASVLGEDGYAAEEHVTVRLSVGASSVGMVIGPVNAQLRADLEGGEADDRIPLRRLLATLVDDVALERRDGAEWLRLEKRVPLEQRRPRR